LLILLSVKESPEKKKKKKWHYPHAPVIVIILIILKGNCEQRPHTPERKAEGKEKWMGYNKWPYPY
jgi:hypothetical protein